jgi:hypothetical protein
MILVTYKLLDWEPRSTVSRRCLKQEAKDLELTTDKITKPSDISGGFFYNYNISNLTYMAENKNIR